MHRLVKHIFLAILMGGTVGTAFAQIQPWQTRQNYQSDTLYGQPNGRSWSPIRGILSGEVHWISNLDGGNRTTYAEASSHAWNQQAIDWMRNNNGTPSIAFHIFDYNGEDCTNWTSNNWAGSNLPAATYSIPLRWCGYNEVRVIGDKNQFLVNTDYIAQVSYRDKTPRNRAKVVVDTYWDGAGNYHQHYCVSDSSESSFNRGTSGCP